jgi:hypothetical protein
LRLTLSVDEAIVWAEGGHTVQVLTEALPLPEAGANETAQTAYDLARSFPAKSGDVTLRIAVLLVAYHSGPCPHLRSDMRCGNYAARPRICRIYPLESRPFINLSPERRLCPPEAWTPDRPLLVLDDLVVDVEGSGIVDEHRRALLDDVPIVSAACAELGVTSAAFAGEGLAVHTPEPLALAASLRNAKSSSDARSKVEQWTVATNRATTMALLANAGCKAILTPKGDEYLGSFPDDA